jgi:hypothetical protein
VRKLLKCDQDAILFKRCDTVVKKLTSEDSLSRARLSSHQERGTADEPTPNQFVEPRDASFHTGSILQFSIPPFHSEEGYTERLIKFL